MSVTPIRDVRAIDVQDLHRTIREMADVFDSPDWRNEPLTGALVAITLRKAVNVGGRRGSRLSTQLRQAIRRNTRRGMRAGHLVVARAVDETESHT